MAKNLLKVACLLLVLFFAAPAHAQFMKPGGLSLPTTVIPDYNLTVSVWAYDTAILGAYIGVFEQHNDGLWYGCTHNMLPDPSFEQHVNDAGGSGPWLATVGMAAVNEALRLCYPPITATPGPPPPSSAGNVAGVNYTLQSYKLNMVGGYATLAPK